MRDERNIDGWQIDYEAIPLIGIGMGGNIDIYECPVWSHQSTVTPNPCLTPELVYSTASIWNANLIPLWEGDDLGLPLAKRQIDEIFTYGLSFWCQSDSELMDQCFRVSERYTTDSDHKTSEWDLPSTVDKDMTRGESQIEHCNQIMDISYDGEYWDSVPSQNGIVRPLDQWR